MNVCRLCLKVSGENMLKLSSESEIMNKISSCLMLLIPIEPLLPNKVCMTCVCKVEDVYQFWKCVKQNENLLNERLKLGMSDSENLNFSIKENNFKNNTKPSDQTKDETVAHIRAFNGHHINNINIVSGQVHETFDSKQVTVENNVDLVPKDYNSYKDREIEIENYHDNGLAENNSYSSEDEMVLSSFKKAKESLLSANNVINENIDKSNIIFQGNELNFKCLSCLKMHKSYEDLQKHYLTVHGRKQVKKVDPSSYTVQKTTDGCLQYNCVKCNKTYIDKRSIVTHVIGHTEQPEDRQFVCKICGRAYRSAADILRHGRAHGAAQLACSYRCGFTTGYAHSLRDHEKRHRADYKYVCAACGRGFLTRTWYEQHQNVHSGARPFRCDLCPKAFHMQKHILPTKIRVLATGGN